MDESSLPLLPPPEEGRDAVDRHWMTQALALARQAADLGEVPVGALLLGADGVVLGAAHNQPIGRHDPTAHAEILALRQGAERLGNYRLGGSTLYVTLEPCAMCAGAILHARVQRLVYAATDPKGGAVVSLYPLLADPRMNHQVLLRGGVCAEEAGILLRAFFRARRA